MLYEATGRETQFTNLIDPAPRSRQIFAFHTPKTLAEWARSAPATPSHNRYGLGEGKGAYDPGPSSLAGRLQALPFELDDPTLWPAQRQAIANLETSLADNRPRALIQMATGARQDLHRRQLRLPADQVRRRQARPVPGRPRQPRPPDAQGVPAVRHARRRPQVHRALQRPAPAPRTTHRPGRPRRASRTIQRLYSMLRGEDELDRGARRGLALRDRADARQAAVPVAYNPSVPIETFDFIIVDECHRSIYSLWRQVLEYFDAFLDRPDRHAQQADASASSTRTS